MKYFLFALGLGLFSYLNLSSHIYYSQFKQDQFVNELIFKNKTNGVFVEIGAFDGISDSNSYFFEKNLNWTGICVEPVAFLFEKLNNNRKSINIHGCIWNKTGLANFLQVTYADGNAHGWSGLVDTLDSRSLDLLQNYWVKERNCILTNITVYTYCFNDICSNNNIKDIDYLSIDTEGSELDILKSINFNLINIKVLGIENSYLKKKMEVQLFLETKGYRFLRRVGADDFFIKNDIAFELVGNPLNLIDMPCAGI